MHEGDQIWDELKDNKIITLETDRIRRCNVCGPEMPLSDSTNAVSNYHVYDGSVDGGLDGRYPCTCVPDETHNNCNI